MYAITFGLWPVYIPCLLEETFIVTLTVQKVLYDRKDRKKKRKEKSNRELFSNTIAMSMKRLSEGDSQLNIMNMTPEEVMEEFKKIDSFIEADGKISKEELKAYIDTGKVIMDEYSILIFIAHLLIHPDTLTIYPMLNLSFLQMGEIKDKE